jgi:two-component system alkaline phosphatase synthesis response regulator PhoP
MPLPANRPSAPMPASGASASPGDPIAIGSVLVVDDNVQNLELLQAYLEDLGCPVRTARDGLEALEQIDREQPDIVLMDIMMPRMSGFQACQKIKANPKTRDIPVIMVTALNEVGDAERAVECGADDFLTKPVSRVELLTRIRASARVRQLTRERDRLFRQLRGEREDDKAK